MQLQTLPRHLVHAYTPQVFTFRVVLRDKFDQETIHTIQTDSDRVCNVLSAVQQQFPRMPLVDLWEVANAAT